MLAIFIAGCGDVGSSGATSAEPASGDPLELDAGRAPLSLSYRVAGNAVVGQPVAIEVSVETALSERPVVLRYRAPEADSLAFPESQAMAMEVLVVEGARRRPQQITVIPNRDGRIFLTVSASIETDTGAVSRSISVPIDVRRAPPGAA